MPVPDQIVVLLALINGFFDTIPINKMQEAEDALQKINTELSAEILKRLVSDKEMSSQDREVILSIANNLLTPFQEIPEPIQNKQ